MSTPPRTRMPVAARREELLRVGSKLFATRPYDEVWIDHVAKEGGVSPSLIYHYFGSKSAFVIEVVKRESESLRKAIVVDAALPPHEGFLVSLDTYLDHIEEHPHGYVATTRGLASADPEVRDVLAGNRRVVIEQVLGQLVSGTPSPAQRMIAQAWVVSMADMCMSWLVDGAVDRTVLRDLIIRSYAALREVIADVGEAAKHTQ